MTVSQNYCFQLFSREKTRESPLTGLLWKCSLSKQTFLGTQGTVGGWTTGRGESSPCHTTCKVRFQESVALMTLFQKRGYCGTG